MRCLDLHRGPVNDLSFDNDGEHIASCSDDCSVTVRQQTATQAGLVIGIEPQTLVLVLGNPPKGCG